MDKETKAEIENTKTAMDELRRRVDIIDGGMSAHEAQIQKLRNDVAKLQKEVDDHETELAHRR